LLAVIQVQITHRGTGFSVIRYDDVDLTELQGNAMFSEGLNAWATVPAQMPFFANNFPGDGAMRALPQTAFWFVIGPIPRALWQNKPVDQGWAWRAETDVYGRDFQGTTVSTGLVGWWYVRYGAAGVIQGGILFGLLIRIFERVLQNAGGRFFVLMLSLAYLTELFRMYRDFVFINTYPIMMAHAFLWFLGRLYSRS